MNPRRILVVGATGMLGHVLYSVLAEDSELEVHGTARAREGLERWFSRDLLARLHGGVDAQQLESVQRALDAVCPEVVINCVGAVKQRPVGREPAVAIAVNALFPHLLARASAAAGARLIHVSTDCVFSGEQGRYREEDRADAEDLYGRTKLLGEVLSPGCVTLRTSLIGHELEGSFGLLEWFLAQAGAVRGFARAIFSGLPTVELARIVAERVIPNQALSGLYHLASTPIAKLELLRLVAMQYGKTIEIAPDHELACDRSLDASKFCSATGYEPPAWPALVAEMHAHFLGSPWYRSRAR